MLLGFSVLDCDYVSPKPCPVRLSALGQKRSFALSEPNVRFAPKAVIRAHQPAMSCPSPVSEPLCNGPRGNPAGRRTRADRHFREANTGGLPAGQDSIYCLALAPSNMPAAPSLPRTTWG